ncbi:MAG TPA: hypothetical protein VFA59_03140 [Vicinamibacterales bacterium]|nr:hypothetical protein [Vicinamibacterales bacterium]
MKHAGAVAFFAIVAGLWTWPLAAHLSTALPGNPGDNYSFIWNFWWMRHALHTGGRYFFTPYLFAPTGTTIVDHPHTALPAFIGATLLARASTVTAHNVLLLCFVGANMAAAYALAWQATGDVLAALFAGLTFGLSPYIAAQRLGHFDLTAAWLVPAFAVCWLRARRDRAWPWAATAGMVAAMAAYTAYYYVAYLALFAVVDVAFTLNVASIRVARRVTTSRLRRVRIGCALAALAFAISAAVLRTEEFLNIRTLAWVALLGVLACTWRMTVRVTRPDLTLLTRSAVRVAAAAAAFAVVTTPLIWEAVQVAFHGDYVTPAYQWHSAPRGVDIATVLLGPPSHPWFGGVARYVYARFHIDSIESVMWIGVAPLTLAVLARARGRLAGDTRWWRIVAVVFGALALGPFLIVLGWNTGLWLPEVLARFVPVVANARMPGRMTVLVYLAIAMLGAIALADRRSHPLSIVAIVAVLIEYWAAPMPLTLVDQPALYATLRGLPAGALCTVPFGFGDGLSGVGSQDRRVLYDATLHEHPLVGGFIGRMPREAETAYAATPFTSAVLRLQAGGPVDAEHPVAPSQMPCRYVLVMRDATPAPLVAYLARLPLERVAEDEVRTLYRVVP